MNDEITAMIDEIKAMRRMRQYNAAHCLTHGSVTELPRCPHCGTLAPWCECPPYPGQDRQDYREARETPETTGRIILHGKEEVY